MNRIYIVTSNDIEDHSPAAAFSTEDLANEYIETVGEGYRFVVELEVDKYSQQIRDGLKIQTVIMDKVGGILQRRKDVDWSDPGYPGDERWSWSLNRTDTPDLQFSVLARDEAHAINIVNEQWAELIKLNLWPNRDAIQPPKHFWAESFEEFKAVTRERVGGGG